MHSIQNLENCRCDKTKGERFPMLHWKKKDLREKCPFLGFLLPIKRLVNILVWATRLKMKMRLSFGEDHWSYFLSSSTIEREGFRLSLDHYRARERHSTDASGNGVLIGKNNRKLWPVKSRPIHFVRRAISTGLIWSEDVGKNRLPSVGNAGHTLMWSAPARQLSITCRKSCSGTW